MRNIHALATRFYVGGSEATSSNCVIDGATEKVAMKFWPSMAATVTHVDAYMVWTGDCSGITYTLQIETDSGGAPSGSVVGAATSAFAGQNATSQWCGGGTNPIALGSSANLSLNTWYWLVMSVASGTPDSTHKVAVRRIANDSIHGELCRHYNGSDWTTTTLDSAMGLICIKDTGGTLCAGASGQFAAPIGVTAIYSTNRQGVRFTYGSQITLGGIALYLYYTGTPNSLVVKVYESDTQRISQTITLANIANGAVRSLLFTTPYTFPSDAVITVLLSQESDGGDSSNNYRIATKAYKNNNYAALSQSSGYWGFVAGTGDTPSTYTINADQFAFMQPLIDLPESGFDCAASGGGGGPLISGRLVR